MCLPSNQHQSSGPGRPIYNSINILVSQVSSLRAWSSIQHVQRVRARGPCRARAASYSDTAASSPDFVVYMSYNNRLNHSKVTRVVDGSPTPLLRNKPFVLSYSPCNSRIHCRRLGVLGAWSSHGLDQGRCYIRRGISLRIAELLWPGVCHEPKKLAQQGQGYKGPP